MDEVQKPEKCPHGYPPAWRRHCRECEHDAEIAEFQSIISQQSKRIIDFEAKIIVLEQDNEMLEETVSQQSAEIERLERRIEKIERAGYV